MYGRVGQGKSSLLNLLLDRELFKPGATANSETRGIGMVVQYRNDVNSNTLIYLDTEGTGKEDSRDKRILSLVFAISSAIIYNFKDKFDGTKVNLVSDLSAAVALKDYISKRSDIEVNKFFLLQRDWKEDWVELPSLVSSWVPNHEEAASLKLLSSERCFSLPKPGSEGEHDFCKFKNGLGPLFMNKFEAFQWKLLEYTNLATPTTGESIINCWSEMWKLVSDNSSFNRLLPSVVSLILDHQHRALYDTIVESIKKASHEIKDRSMNLSPIDFKQSITICFSVIILLHLSKL